MACGVMRYLAVEIDEDAVYQKSLAINALRESKEFVLRASNSVYRPQELEKIFAYPGP